MRWNIGSWDARNDAGELIARVKLLDYPTGAEYRVEWCGERHSPRTFSSMVQAMRNVEELDYRERVTTGPGQVHDRPKGWPGSTSLPEAEVLRRPDALQRAYDWLAGPPLSGQPVEHPPIVDSEDDWEGGANRQPCTCTYAEPIVLGRMIDSLVVDEDCTIHGKKVDHG